MNPIWRCILFCSVVMLSACGHAPKTPDTERPGALQASPAAVRLPTPVPGFGSWKAATWDELPGFEDDALYEAWNAWLKSCERPSTLWARLCPQVRRLSIATAAEQRQWLQDSLQPYSVLNSQGDNTGLLTAYFEPEFEARRVRTSGFEVPLYQPPADLRPGQGWYSRQQLDTLPEVQLAMQGRVIAYLADPVQAMLLQIQGSGRLQLTEPDGQQRLVRVAYAGHNGHPYQSIGRWLLDQGELRDASWPGIRAWLLQNPQRSNELMWRNPRVVFFKEEALSEFDRGFGPRGAQGVALTPGRSIAIDPQSIPYGTPVWLASAGQQLVLQRLVLAQDTGSAIQGAVRADYFAGWGAQAGELAGRLKQPLRLWVLWPKPL